MKGEELRIGNYITRPHDPSIICHVTWGVIKDVSQGSHSYIPILLTEEWLLKFGFTLVRVPSAYGWDCNKVFDGGVFRGAWSGLVEDKHFVFLDFLINGVHKQIKYVHELQNLYYALTGQELTRK